MTAAEPVQDSPRAPVRRDRDELAAARVRAHDRRRRISERWDDPGGRFRSLTHAALEARQFLNLSKSARNAWVWGWVRSGGQYAIAVSSTVGSFRTGMCERTWRRCHEELLEAGAVELATPGGGAHDTPNRWLYRCLDAGYRPPTLKGGGTGPPVRFAPWARPGGRRRPVPPASAEDSAPGDAGAPPDDAGVPPDEDPCPLVQAVVDDAPLPPEVVERAREHWLREYAPAGSSAEELAVLWAAFDAGALRMSAREWGLLAEEPPAGQATELPTDAEGLARAMVRDFFRSSEIARSAYPYEIAIARSVVAHAGARAWELYAKALARLTSWRRRGRAGVPQRFRYLVEHLQAVGGLPVGLGHDPGPSEQRPPTDA